MRKIQRMLGHDQLKTTDKIYAKHRRGYTREVADVADLQVVPALLEPEKQSPERRY
jgi:integrase